MVNGWLANKQKAEVVRHGIVFNDKFCDELIERINDSSYTKLKGTAGKILRMRDLAILSLFWTFGKRASEIRTLKRKDVWYDENFVYVNFTIRKKAKRTKICSRCKKPNGYKNKYCKECGEDLSNVEVKVVGKEIQRIKQKSIAYKYLVHLLNWIHFMDSIKLKSDALLFPAIRMKPVPLGRGRVDHVAKFDWYGKPITRRRFGQIVEKWDPRLTNHTFRYNFVRRLYKYMGMSPHEIKYLTDHASSYMPEVYLQVLPGYSEAERKFANDVREIR